MKDRGVEKKLLTQREKNVEAYDIAISAIEKQIPKKPIMKQYFDDSNETYLCCPACGGFLQIESRSTIKIFISIV